MNIIDRSVNIIDRWADNLDERMSYLEISVRDLAKASEVSPQAVYRWLDGKPIQLVTLERVAKALKCTASDLLA